MDKKGIHERCRWLVAQKIDQSEAAIQEAQRAANEETKSSAGDKYETGRAMMHLEQEKLASQRAAALQLKKVLDQIDPDRLQPQVTLGSLLQTNRGWFYVAVGLGQIEVGHESCFVISPAAPLAKALWGRKAQEVVQFDQETIRILLVR